MEDLKKMIAKAKREELYLKLASSFKTSSKTLDRIVCKTDDYNILEWISGHPKTSNETLDKIIDKTNNVFVLRRIVENKNISSENIDKIVDKIVDKTDGNVDLIDNNINLIGSFLFIIENEKISSETLDKLVDKLVDKNSYYLYLSLIKEEKIPEYNSIKLTYHKNLRELTYKKLLTKSSEYLKNRKKNEIEEILTNITSLIKNSIIKSFVCSFWIVLCFVFLALILKTFFTPDVVSHYDYLIDNKSIFITFTYYLIPVCFMIKIFKEWNEL